MDLIIRKEDGWLEITEWLIFDYLDVPKLWRAVGAGDWGVADDLIREALSHQDEVKYEDILYRDAGDDWDGEIGDWDKRVKPQVKIVSIPDDMKGDRYRVWIRLPPGPFDWMPKD